MRERLRGLPPWAWLSAIVVCSAVLRVLLAQRMVSPWIMVDELIYSELAKSVGEQGRFLIRGVPSGGYGFVYPLLIAPAFRLFADVPSAYAVAKAINAVTMSLAAVPAYFLARRVLARGSSLGVAGLSVLVPSMLYTGTLMTENVFYPLFLLACLALVVMLERPTPLRQIGVLLVCALCFETRAQALALFGAAVVAPLLHGWFERDSHRRLRMYGTLYGAVALVAVLALAATVARGRSPLSLLGAYRAATGSGYSVSEIAHYLVWHIAELDLYVGIVGFAALLALWIAPRAASPPARAFAAASLCVSGFLLVEVAAFASRQSFRIEERNDFYLAPLALIALFGLATDGVVPRARRAIVPAALVAGLLPATIPLGRFVNTSAVSDTLGLMPWWWVQDQGIHFGPLRVVALVLGVVTAVAFVTVRRRFALVFIVTTGAYFVLTGIVAENGRHGMHQASVGGLWAGIRLPDRDWVDRRVGPHADVAFLWHYTGETRPLWNNEFFNRSVRDVYTVDGPDPADGGLPETPVRERADGTIVTASGSAPRVIYAVSYTDIAGRAVARDPRIGLALYHVDGPLVVLTRVTGIYANDTWSGRHVSYRRLRCSGGHLAVRLGTDEHLFQTAQVVTATVGKRVVAQARVLPSEQPTLQVPLRANAEGTCSVTFTMQQLRVPSLVQNGSTDTRRLGAHFFAIDFAR